MRDFYDVPQKMKKGRIYKKSNNKAIFYDFPQANKSLCGYVDKNSG